MGLFTKRFHYLLLITIIVILTFGLVAEAKPSLSLSLYKNNGYGLGNDMNGQWTLNAAVSPDVVRVEFYIDGQLQLNDTTAPFSWEFNTGNYSEGQHYIKAVAFDAADETTIVQIDRNFVGFPTTFVFSIIAVIVAVAIVVLLVAVYRIRKKK